ncbi:helix-turn-helix domain-containing protein [Aneurinibacillus tyrosinisolvens]|uniref:helix-turn-helix domain-containing protein n=1 Tax=Aneurinibacillus tyrosinisolvens TaxID=1443435 RepID=UPI00063F83CC|nr:helix-turn-helix domain-containing protein [Aneurinibacillus tyrosinisolvens]
MKKIQFNLEELLWRNRMTQKELHEKTVIVDKLKRPVIGENERWGVRQATISEMCNGKTKRIPVESLELIAEVLELDDINKIVSIVEVEE